METIRQLLAGDCAGLTVYTPDCAPDRLWGALERTIRVETGLDVVLRTWIHHDVLSLRCFYGSGPGGIFPEGDLNEARHRYENVPPGELRPWHLLAELYAHGPALLTIWRGQGATRALAKIKGATHPADADPLSIRGRFHCDNGICNLIHASDDTAEVERELTVLELQQVLDQPAHALDPLSVTTSVAMPAHSGIATLCAVVERLLWTETGTTSLGCALPDGGGARETMRVCSGALIRVANEHPQPFVAGFIEAFLSGDVVAVTAASRIAPTTRWERFVLQCGAMSRAKWNAGR